MNRSVTRLLPAVAAFWFISHIATVSHAEPVEVVIESVRLECSHCPEVFELYERSLFKEDSSAVNVALQAVEKAAVKHVIFRHTQWIEPERRVRQTTQTHDSTLILDVLVSSADQKSFTVQFDAKFTQRPEGEKHENEYGCATTLTCALGGTFLAGGSATRAESPGNPPKLEVCFFRVGVKKIDPGD
ncbi:MAG: hypothetical protein O3C40_12965 [Planctomycetota bacterium]|nr:hypothetical protein [Planctomycetota bacterium]